MSAGPERMPTMSPYEERRWSELQRHWAKKAERRQLLPPKAGLCSARQADR
ncbi:hypothetical protein ABZU25_23035 [Micromonospora sp. NPDC005215]|uniref:hypothetical protein n=1 Tax=Micromonospora sp. NPDC005215 TaxID=3157024 RepID=UPI0033A7D29E